MDTSPKCLRCGDAMEEGFIADRGDGAIVHVPMWIHGQPERSFLGGAKVRGREHRLVQTFRCPKCGCLESYAKAIEV